METSSSGANALQKKPVTKSKAERITQVWLKEAIIQHENSQLGGDQFATGEVALAEIQMTGIGEIELHTTGWTWSTAHTGFSMS